MQEQENRKIYSQRERDKEEKRERKKREEKIRRSLIFRDRWRLKKYLSTLGCRNLLRRALVKRRIKELEREYVKAGGNRKNIDDSSFSQEDA